MVTRKQLMEFMGKQKTVMICSVDEDGYPNAKAMFSPRKIENDYFYFSSNVSAKRTAQYLQNPYACIYAYQKGRFRYEGWMLIGEMKILTDQESKKDNWQLGDRLYYKQGVNDPDYCVYRFKAIRGRRYIDLKSEDFVMDELE